MLALSIAMLSTMIFGGAISSLSIDFTTTEDNIKAVFGILEKWQTFLAGIFGFVALLVGHMLNVSSQRKRDDEIRQQDKADRSAALKAQQRSLAAAFQAELKAIGADASGNLGAIEGALKDKKNEEDLLKPSESMEIIVNTIYTANTDKIGNLPATITGDIVRCYNDVNFFNNLRILGVSLKTAKVQIEMIIEDAEKVCESLSDIINDEPET